MAKAIQIIINPHRLEYLLHLFNRTKQSLQEIIGQNIDFDKPLNKTTLKAIDTIFQVGLDFYTNPSPIDTHKSSILFRKDNLKKSLDIGDIQFITQYEKEINYINSLAKLGDFQFTMRKLKSFTLQDSPFEAAMQMQFLLPTKKLSDKQFLESLINNLAEQNILVLENIESHNKKYKSNLCGFFIEPNVIVLKQQGRKREIFTLAHELGHYLLKNENIDENIFVQNPNNEENWCNQFAFALLLGENFNELENIPSNAINLENKVIQNLSERKHISRLALFYHFARTNKIQWVKYKQLKENLNDEYMQKKQKNKNNQDNTIFKAPIPVLSPLQKDIFINAFLEGVVSEYTILTHFKRHIENNNLERFLYE
ncbi:ImmA/IrrE family metallo-endopeptidase [Campylobacter sp. MIT 21-1685]|uniref:ImmA/IrrE family metallo-endopeptidase n=1 Tax=unclassified Campylobacter TaxID=2593542 RepID=UPI00224B0A4E|nr:MULTISPECIES: ImmA/IrrE family metallo-endopeptidase [unclassified Campylobacter]MCX2683856.1 ImmA/IrrE family metallo-endopeptidase [Campylobacter sp. MIT 21-1684]MCX2752140.1 ImmA/IrrE family metallo-endopeptidase [Campylobacter sp. MIT 21-1682]MCX2808333.1 ImmA/IrrE family metallo-endopeptidase [Campylobacter sp. MIT 21-1685]